MSVRVLIVEDDPLTADAIAFLLRREQWATTIVGDGEAALEAMNRSPFELVVLDIGLPGMSGFDVVRLIRRRGDVPVLVLTARTSMIDKVVALELAADDYMVKPYAGPELVARLRALLRRRALGATAAGGSVLRLGSVEIDFDRGEAVVDGRSVHLTPAELKVLRVMSAQVGRVVSRQELVKELWSSDFVGDGRICDAHIARLRRKLERDPGRPTHILTARGRGYCLVSD